MKLNTTKLSVSLALALTSSVLLAQTNETTKLDEISVTTKAFSESEGGIATGFLAKDVNLGPLGDKKAIDVPYQINTIPKEIIKNQRSRGLEDVVKYVPSAQIEQRGGAEVGRPQTRGMRGDVVANSFWDGFHVVSTTATPMAQFDSLQIQNGLAGSLYGAQNPSGIYNFTLKRPTDTFENSLLFTYTQKANFGVDVDLGGKTQYVGYRANLLYNDGEFIAKDSTLRRKLASLGLDFYLTDYLTLETNFIYYNYIKEGHAGQFNMPINTLGQATYTLPSAVDSSKKGLGQEYAGMDLTTKTASGKLKYEIADNWYAEAGYLTQRADRGMYGVTNTFTSNNGDYRAAQGLNKATTNRFEIDSWLARVNTKQNFFEMDHDISLGGSGYNWQIISNTASLPNPSASKNLGNSSINNPTSFPNPGGFSTAKKFKKASETIVNSITLADSIKINENWEAMFSISESWMKSKSFNTTTGAKTSSRSDSGESYAASIIYKPLDTWSIYVTYADSLQAGDTGSHADGTAVVLKPYRSKQYEIGTKVMLDYVDLSAAVFQIERPIAYLGNDALFREQGDQKNIGFEFMAAGKLTDDLSLFGGFTYIDSELSGTKVAGTNKKQVIGIPKWQANMLLEYTVPSFEELVLSTNLHYTGKRAIDQANTQWADDYYTVDLAARYATKVYGQRTIFRLSVNNVFNEKYWAGVFASNGLDGEARANQSHSLFLGESRSITASVEVRF
ncbi:MAG: TonB-dependent receptor [Campylobacteraceae bacterium]